jgi:tetrahydromethanopterin S-methyltransferase subunit A
VSILPCEEDDSNIEISQEEQVMSTERVMDEDEVEVETEEKDVAEDETAKTQSSTHELEISEPLIHMENTKIHFEGCDKIPSAASGRISGRAS